MLDQINPRYHQYLQQAVPPDQYGAFAALPPQEQEGYYLQWAQQSGQEPIPAVEEAAPNPLSGTPLLINPDSQEIAVSRDKDQFSDLGLIRSIHDLERVALHVSNSKIGPKAYWGNPSAAFTTLLHGYEMKISPMVAIHAIHIMEGRATASIHLIRSLLERSGTEIETLARYEPVYDQQGGIADYTSLTRMYKRSRLGRGAGGVITSDYPLSYIQCQMAGWVRKNGPWEKMPFIMLPTRNTVIHGREFNGSALNGMYEHSEINAMADYDDDGNLK